MGEYAQSGEVLVGDTLFDSFTGDGVLTLVGERTGLRCEGDIWVEDAGRDPLTCQGMTGAFQLFCDDARQVKGDWRARGCEAGAAMGEDSRGETLSFFFGMDPAAEQAFLDAARDRVGDRPPLAAQDIASRGPATVFFIDVDGLFIAPVAAIGDGREVTINGGRGVDVLSIDTANGLGIGLTRTNEMALPLADSPPRMGEQVAILGRNGAAIATIDRDRTDPRRLSLNRSFDAAYLGAPVVDAYGRVVGVVALPNGRNRFDALRIDYAAALAASVDRSARRLSAGGPRFSAERLASAYGPAIATIAPR